MESPSYNTYTIDEVIENDKKYDVDKLVTIVELSKFSKDEGVEKRDINPNAHLLKEIQKMLGPNMYIADIYINDNDEITCNICDPDVDVGNFKIKTKIDKDNVVYLEGDLKNVQNPLDYWISRVCALEGKYLIEIENGQIVPIYTLDGSLCFSSLEYEDFIKELKYKAKLDLNFHGIEVDDTIYLSRNNETVHIKKVYIGLGIMDIHAYFLLTTDGRILLSHSLAEMFGEDEVQFESVFMDEWIRVPECMHDVLDNITIGEIPNRQSELNKEFIEILRDAKKLNCHIRMFGDSTFLVDKDNRELFEILINWKYDSCLLHYMNIKENEYEIYGDIMEKLHTHMNNMFRMWEIIGLDECVLSERVPKDIPKHTQRLSLH